MSYEISDGKGVAGGILIRNVLVFNIKSIFGKIVSELLYSKLEIDGFYPSILTCFDYFFFTFSCVFLHCLLQGFTFKFLPSSLLRAQLSKCLRCKPYSGGGDKLRFSDLSFRFDGIYGVFNASRVAKFLSHNNCMTKQ